MLAADGTVWEAAAEMQSLLYSRVIISVLIHQKSQSFCMLVSFNLVLYKYV